MLNRLEEIKKEAALLPINKQFSFTRMSNEIDNCTNIEELKLLLKESLILSYKKDEVLMKLI